MYAAINRQLMTCVKSMVYLGNLVLYDSYVASELGQRIRLAHADVSTLYRILSHANITVVKKLTHFNVFIVSKLILAVDGMWLSNTELKRVDAFHCTCIRRILKIQHSFYSRISNEVVLERAKAKPLNSILSKRHLKLFGRIALMHSCNILRLLVFAHDSFSKPLLASRRRGRPRACWVDELHSMATRIAGSGLDLTALLNQCSSLP